MAKKRDYWHTACGRPLCRFCRRAIWKDSEISPEDEHAHTSCKEQANRRKTRKKAQAVSKATMEEHEAGICRSWWFIRKPWPLKEKLELDNESTTK